MRLTLWSISRQDIVMLQLLIHKDKYGLGAKIRRDSAVFHKDKKVAKLCHLQSKFPSFWPTSNRWLASTNRPLHTICRKSWNVLWWLAEERTLYFWPTKMMSFLAAITTMANLGSLWTSLGPLLSQDVSKRSLIRQWRWFRPAIATQLHWQLKDTPMGGAPINKVNWVWLTSKGSPTLRSPCFSKKSWGGAFVECRAATIKHSCLIASLASTQKRTTKYLHFGNLSWNGLKRRTWWRQINILGLKEKLKNH